VWRKLILLSLNKMETIPPIYWMIIIVIGVGFVCLVLYEIAMLIRESKEAVRDSRAVIVESQKTVEKANNMLDEVQSIVSTTKDTVAEISKSIISPVRKISSLLGVASSFVEGVQGKRK
jgi:Na+-transporting methylmalonyl-CoA/oxaloacetate decarboxylase gamma subunit